MLEKLKITSPVLTWYQQFFKIGSESEVLHCNMIGNGLQMLGNKFIPVVANVSDMSSLYWSYQSVLQSYSLSEKLFCFCLEAWGRERVLNLRDLFLTTCEIRCAGAAAPKCWFTWQLALLLPTRPSQACFVIKWGWMLTAPQVFVSVPPSPRPCVAVVGAPCQQVSLRTWASTCPPSLPPPPKVYWMWLNRSPRYPFSCVSPTYKITSAR